jgi:hypothetical protein
MRRHADADPDPETGQNRAISAAYYIEAVPAFHTTVDAQIVANAHESEAAVGQQVPLEQQAAAQQ